MTWNINFKIVVSGTPPEGGIAVGGYKTPDSHNLTVSADGMTATAHRYPTSRKPIGQLAQEAYEAYGQTTGGKDYQGLPMPEWADLGEQIQNAWRAAVSRATGRE